MPDYSSSNKRLAKNSIFLSLRMVLVLCISLYTTRVVLRILGVEDYGVYNVVCGFVSMFAFLNGSMGNGIQRFFNFELGKNGTEGANRVYCTALLIQAILAFFVIALTESFGIWYMHHKMVIPEVRQFAAEWIFQFSIISFLFIIMQAPYTAAIIAHERMDFYAIISVVDALLKLGIAILLPFLGGDKLILYGLLLSLINVINFLLYYFYCKKSFPEIRFRRYFDRELFKSMLGFSGWNLFGSFSGVMQGQGINLVLNFFFGPVVNAARGIATQVNGAMQSFVGSITMPVRPQVVQSYARGEFDRTMNLTYSISKLSCGFFAIMAIPIALDIDFILRVWLGDNVPDHTAAFTVLVLLTALTSNLNAAISNVVHATGKMMHYQLWGSLVKISSVPVAYLFLLRFDIPEIALICVWILNLVGHFIGLFVFRTLVSFSLVDYLKKVFFPVIGVVLIGIIVSLPVLLLQPGWLRFGLLVVIGGISVSVSLYYLAMNDSERELMKSLVNRFLPMHKS